MQASEELLTLTATEKAIINEYKSLIKIMPAEQTEGGFFYNIHGFLIDEVQVIIADKKPIRIIKDDCDVKIDVELILNLLRKIQGLSAKFIMDFKKKEAEQKKLDLEKVKNF